MKRYAIYGAGSLGTVLGAYITKNGGEIDLINRNKAHVAALQTKGATITGTLNFTQEVKAFTPDEMSGVYDIIFLMTKQLFNAEVVTFLKDYLAEDGTPSGTHGGDSEHEMKVFFGAVGRGVKNTVLKDARIQDVAAIACYALGINGNEGEWESIIPEDLFKEI